MRRTGDVMLMLSVRLKETPMHAENRVINAQVQERLEGEKRDGV